MGKVVLVISNTQDAHVDIIGKKIEERGIQWIRWDTDSILKRKLGYGLEAGDFLREASFEIASRGILKENPDLSIWYRRPTPPVFSAEVEPHVKDYILREFDGWLSNMCLSIPGFWVSPYSSLQQSRSKLHQILAASKVGLLTPETLVTDRSDLAKEFWDRCKGRVVAKAFSVQNVEKGEELLIINTKRVGEQDLPELVRFPCMLQREIKTIHELRVVVIGRRVFSFGIRSKIETADADLRLAGFQNLEHFEASLSQSSEKALTCLLDYYGLSFCSADFLVTSGGEEFFVDLNPNGQWLWLEYVTGVSLSEHFVTMLEEGGLLR